MSRKRKGIEPSEPLLSQSSIGFEDRGRHQSDARFQAEGSKAAGREPGGRPSRQRGERGGVEGAGAAVGEGGAVGAEGGEVVGDGEGGRQQDVEGAGDGRQRGPGGLLGGALRRARAL